MLGHSIIQFCELAIWIVRYTYAFHIWMGVGGSGSNWDRMANFEYNEGLEHELHAIIFILLHLVLKIILFQITSFPLFTTICIP
jgi:hypothetical protein